MMANGAGSKLSMAWRLRVVKRVPGAMVSGRLSLRQRPARAAAMSDAKIGKRRYERACDRVRNPVQPSLHRSAACRASPLATNSAARYARHVPERTLLYVLVEAHYPDFIARIKAEGRSLPEYVCEEFDEYLRYGVLEHGFLRVVCQ
jgi:hypothetical protein